MSVRVSCPACAGPITFAVGSSLVAVCPYCRSAVARGDRELKDLGKVAALLDTDSPLELGMHGKMKGVRFDLVGRTQLKHSKGGVWDEWYARFADGRWGWLAEAQGRFYLTFEEAWPDDTVQPDPSGLELGEEIAGLPTDIPLVVAEKGRAQVLAAEGEMPWDFTPEASYKYVDLSGPGGAFATLSTHAGQTYFYLGREVALSELGVPANAKKRGEPKQVSAVHINCPQCGGALELRAPDQAQRVGCPNCASLLSVEEGQLSYLEAMSPDFQPALPLGTKAQFEETEFTLIGALQRVVTFDGIEYPWAEYLLYHPHQGFRWLVQSENHWSYVNHVPSGSVKKYDNYVSHQGTNFKLFQVATASVTAVFGECYWKVAIGEQVEMRDFIAPPLGLSREKDTEEINWSLSTYLPVNEVETRLGISGLPAPIGVGPLQTFGHKYMYALWGLMCLVTFLAGLTFVVLFRSKQAYEHKIAVEPRFVALPSLAVPNGDPNAPGASSVVTAPQTFASEPFELKRWQRIEIVGNFNLSNAGVVIEGDLVNEDGSLAQEFDFDVGYWEGVEEGEAWREGSASRSIMLSAVPAGKYTLQLKLIREEKNNPQLAGGTLDIRVRQGGIRLLHWFFAFLSVSWLPISVGVYHLMFENRRWAESNTVQQNSDDDE